MFKIHLCFNEIIRSPIKLLPSSPNHSQNIQHDHGSNTKVEFMNNHMNLEKSKSDSKLDQFAHNQQQLHQNEAQSPLSVFSKDDNERIKRSNSNQHMERKAPSKKKKAKSFSKLSELDKEVSFFRKYDFLF